MDLDIHHLLKIIVIGDSSVGKTNLLTRFVKNQFSADSKPTIGVDFSTKTVAIDRKNIKVQIWDTAGQERFKAFSSAYYNGSHGAFIVYDITNRDSFENVKTWVTEIKTHLDIKNLVVMLVGNKSDLDTSRAITEEEGRTLAEQYDFFFMETSAKKNESNEVSKAFMVIIEEILQKNPDSPKTGEKGGDRIDVGSKIDTESGSHNKKKSGGCC